MDAHGNNERSFETITRECESYFKASNPVSPCEMAAAIMKSQDIPMHNFAHHYLVPAVLLTAAYRKNGAEIEELEKKLTEAEKRAKNVLPAYCGFYGACGAAIGVGIFLSVYTGTTPLVKETWGLCNMGTADSLAKMAEVGGPRCCKRNTFIALVRGTEYVREKLGLDLGCNDSVECGFSKFNNECLKDDCPFYKD